MVTRSLVFFISFLVLRPCFCQDGNYYQEKIICKKGVIYWDNINGNEGMLFTGDGKIFEYVYSKGKRKEKVNFDIYTDYYDWEISNDTLILKIDKSPQKIFKIRSIIRDTLIMENIEYPNYYHTFYKSKNQKSKIRFRKHYSY